MDPVHFLNLEYFLVLIYRIFTGTNVDISQIPAQTLTVMEDVAWAGLALAVLFLAIFIYERVRLHEVEHAGWHHRQQMIEELAHRHTIHKAKNPQWEQIKLLMTSPQENDWRRAIMEADIMLDNLLLGLGYSGATLGDKLKGANPLQFTTLDLAWKAHKVRNDIAHGGSEFHLTDRDASGAMDMYRRVFEEFDYI